MASLYTLPIENIRSVGPVKAKLFEKLGIKSAGGLVRYYPRDYEDWSNPVSIRDASVEDVCVIRARVVDRPKVIRASTGMLLYKCTVTDDESDMQLTFFNNKYVQNMLLPGEWYYFRGKPQGSYMRREMASPQFLKDSAHVKMLSIYSKTAKLNDGDIRRAVNEVLKMLPEEVKDTLPNDIRREYQLCSAGYALRNIHQPKDYDAMTIASRRLIFEELLVLQLGLRRIKKRIKTENTHVMERDYSREFKELLPFSLTNAQSRAIEESIHDMMSDEPMNRLVQGDVGSGKTAVAAALCFTAIKNGYQAAMMAPTELLAAQHHETLKKMFEGTGINIVLLTGSVKGKEKKAVHSAIKTGEAQMIVGTHALITEGLEYSNLALVITDEQHRFGVDQRTELAEKSLNPHTMVMSATPIPRTLALMMYGDLDISVLDELPKGRKPVKTLLYPSSYRIKIFKAIKKRLDEGRQAFIICPLIDENESDMQSVNKYAEMLCSFFDKDEVAVLHGKMKPAEKDRIMQDFADNKVKILVSTTVVEVGIDVPNATVMVIENAERYGLSQLHQLRGRVGRGQYESFCILISDAQNEEAINRLNVMRDNSDGFKIADQDLKLRGPGDFFGSRQHGLPQMKIADLLKNIDTMNEAKLAADKILSDDPDLLKPEHRYLRTEISQLFSKSGTITV